MNVFMQGMRRSGTTIVYDILCQDREFVNYYEPFAAAREGALGGGSGVQPVDLFSRIRTIRAEFRQLHPGITDEMLNYGAPTKPALEFEPHYGKTTGEWTTDRFIEAAYQSLKK